jgi:HEAT repeat protein
MIIPQMVGMMQTALHNSRFRKTVAMLTCAAALVCWKPKIDRMANPGIAAAAAAPGQSAQDEAGIRKRVDALIKRLDTPHGLAGSGAEEAIIEMGPSVVPVLLEAVGKGTQWQQMHVTHAIIEMGEPAVPELLKGLTHANATARIGAIVLLDALRLTNKLGPRGEEGVTPAMAGRLADQDYRVQLAASGTLVKFGQAAIGPLIRALGDTRNDANTFAASALVDIGAPAAPHVIKAMEGENIPVRIMGETVLMKMAKSAVPALIKGLGNKVSVVRIGCATALGAAEDKRALPALAKAAKEDESEVVRSASAEAIALIRKAGGKAPVAADAMGSMPPAKLVAALGDGNADTRRAARSALTKMDKAAVPALLAGLNNRNIEVRIACAETLGRIGDGRAINPLLRLVPKGDHLLRAAAIEALGDIGDRKAMPALVKAANDTDDLVQKTAIAAILRIDPGYIH